MIHIYISKNKTSIKNKGLEIAQLGRTLDHLKSYNQTQETSSIISSPAFTTYIKIPIDYFVIVPLRRYLFPPDS